MEIKINNMAGFAYGLGLSIASFIGILIVIRGHEWWYMLSTLLPGLLSMFIGTSFNGKSLSVEDSK